MTTRKESPIAPGDVIVAIGSFDLGTGREVTGTVIACIDQPMLITQDAFGGRDSWPIGACRRATPEEQINYWRDRAVRAERQIPTDSLQEEPTK